MNVIPGASAQDRPGNGPKASTVLAVGAAGSFAGLVVTELARRAVNVRGLIRDARQGEAVRGHGAAEVAIGDLRDRASVDAALKGVGAVFYIAPAFIDDEARVRASSPRAWREAGQLWWRLASSQSPGPLKPVSRGSTIATSRRSPP